MADRYRKRYCRDYCGCSLCDYVWLPGLGNFTQGTGFTEEVANEIIAALKAAEARPSPQAEADDLVERIETIRREVDVFHPDPRVATRSIFEAQEKAYRLLPTILTALKVKASPSADTDWFSGDEDCDGNALATVRVDKLQAVVQLIEGFPGYGTATNKDGRLKDQPAWVEFYNLVAALNPETGR